MTSPTNAKDRILEAAERLVYQQGFSATTLDAILTDADASKGAFFHHFESKEVLGDALLERYAASDAELARRMMESAESLSDDPAEQVVSFVHQFANLADQITEEQPGCLFVSFIYERGPGGSKEGDVIVESIELWRQIIVDKLEQVAVSRPDLAEADLPALADMVFTIFEGGFILARATNDPTHLGKQLRHLQNYFELVLGAKPPQPEANK